jgi:hypothetical protein
MTIYLLMSKQGLSPITVTCAINGDANGMRGTIRQFNSILELDEALGRAGVSGHEMNTALQVVRSGYPSYLSVSMEGATKLGLIEEH